MSFWVSRECRSSPHPNPLPRGEGACSLLHGSLRRARFWSPSYSLRRVLLSRTRGRTPSERRWAMDGPSARAVGQECEPKEPDVSRAKKRGRRPLVTLGLSKVTRPSPKGGRNPVEGEALASCAVKPCHHFQSANVRIRCAIRTYDSITPGDYGFPHPDPLPRGEGTKTLGVATSRE